MKNALGGTDRPSAHIQGVIYPRIYWNICITCIVYYTHYARNLISEVESNANQDKAEFTRMSQLPRTQQFAYDTAKP
jgi:hypothetical protein